MALGLDVGRLFSKGDEHLRYNLKDDYAGQIAPDRW